MLNDILAHIGRFIFFIILQALILNDIGMLNGLVIPYLYIAFLLMLPIEIPRWLELVLGLVCGLVMDMFTNTLGLHASACLTLAFIRPLLLRAIAPRDRYEFGQKPSIQAMGLFWYVKYAGLLILVHHSWLFFIEVYSFKNLHLTLLRIILSAILTFVLAVLSQYLLFSRRNKSFA